MKLLILICIISCVMALPARRAYYKRYAGNARLQAAPRARRAPLPLPQRTMLISGYYRPLFAQRRQGFEPETAMTAFATGDSVAAGSYLGTKAGPCASCDNTEFLNGPDNLNPQAELDQTQYQEDNPADFSEQQVPLQDPEEQSEAELAPVKPARTPKKKPSKKVQKPEDDDEAEDDEIAEEVVPKRNRGPYSSFFPIVFSGYPGGARSGAGGGGSGGVTAIANSYSTGKGGVATSHATAYGGPPPPQRPRKRTEKPVEADDDEE